MHPLRANSVGSASKSMFEHSSSSSKLPLPSPESLSTGKFRVHFHAGVVNVGHLRKESLLVSLVGLGDDLLLVGVQGKQLALLLGVQGLVAGNAVVDLVGQDGHQGVVLIGHGAVSNALESRLERGLLDGGGGLGVREGVLHLLEGT